MLKKILTLTMGLYLLLVPCISFAQENSTDDAGVLAGLEDNTDLYNYLNYYNYHLWKSDHRWSIHDMYISSDDAVIIDTWNGRLGHIYILKPGYSTNKGIQLGMTYDDVINTYGYASLSTFYDSNYAGYVYLEYASNENEGLSFVFNKYTEKVVLIRYQKNRHGNTMVSQDVKSYALLPTLR